MYFRGLQILLVMLILPYLLELVLQKIWITQMRSLKIKQVTKLYGPSWHEKNKTGTPTMGGVVFIPVLLISLLVWSVFFESYVDIKWIFIVASYPLLAAVVGFADDWIKHKRGSADGFTSIQKFVLQVVTTFLWILFIAPEGTAEVALMGFQGSGKTLPAWGGVIILTFCGVGLQNAVNVTDGLDGLAAGCAAMSMVFSLIIYSVLGNIVSWGIGTLLISFSICVAFLWHNSHPALVFMGDVGAHFIAGVLFTVFALSDVFLLIIPVSFIFGVEMISVVIQIIAIRFFKRKVFRMSPIHHHFEMLGWSETQIVTRFYIIHLIGFMVIFTAILLLA